MLRESFQTAKGAFYVHCRWKNKRTSVFLARRQTYCVMVTFDYDAEFLRISRAKSKGTTIGFTDFSRGQYGPHEGLARCLNMLDTMNINLPFCCRVRVIETYLDTVEEIHRRGHELACHGYRHESDPELSRDEMIKILDKSEALLAEITGKKPVGHRHRKACSRILCRSF